MLPPFTGLYGQAITESREKCYQTSGDWGPAPCQQHPPRLSLQDLITSDKNSQTLTRFSNILVYVIQPEMHLGCECNSNITHIVIVLS